MKMILRRRCSSNLGFFNTSAELNIIVLMIMKILQMISMWDYPYLIENVWVCILNEMLLKIRLFIMGLKIYPLTHNVTFGIHLWDILIRLVIAREINLPLITWIIETRKKSLKHFLFIYYRHCAKDWESL